VIKGRSVIEGRSVIKGRSVNKGRSVIEEGAWLRSVIHTASVI